MYHLRYLSVRHFLRLQLVSVCGVELVRYDVFSALEPVSFNVDVFLAAYYLLRDERRFDYPAVFYAYRSNVLRVNVVKRYL